MKQEVELTQERIASNPDAKVGLYRLQRLVVNSWSRFTDHITHIHGLEFDMTLKA